MSDKSILKSGPGWRIGWNPDAIVYKALLGSDFWAFELTKEELNDFQRLLIQLNETMIEMSQHLMEEETINCEVESDLILLQAQGYYDHYSLTLIIHQNRRGEGYWEASVIPFLIKATQNLTCF